MTKNYAYNKFCSQWMKSPLIREYINDKVDTFLVNIHDHIEGGVGFSIHPYDEENDTRAYHGILTDTRYADGTCLRTNWIAFVGNLEECLNFMWENVDMDCV